MAKSVSVGGVKIGGKNPLVIIAGPCVIESKRSCIMLARKLVSLAAEIDIPLIFKASYDKANRSSHRSFRGIGLEQGLQVLAQIREELGVPVLTDVHTEAEAEAAGKVVDMLQIPAFLCRQTDLVSAVAETGKPVNVKKGQFLSPWDMTNVVNKIESTGNRKIVLTERGACFGYNNLVADMRSLLVMRELGYPVVFDATHSVQRPGAGGDKSSGDSKWAPALARAAVGTGCDAVFIETHPNPAKALSDGANAVPFSKLRATWETLRKIDEIVD